jgi:hypothetical protein
MSSSTMRVAPDILLGDSADGGVRPAARWPASVRSRRPSWDPRVASARVDGSAFFPVAVRALRFLDLPAGLAAPFRGCLAFVDFFFFVPVRAMAGN